MVSGIPSIVNVDENNICNIVVENCTPYDVTLERDNILGVMETEEDKLVPLMDDLISSVCQDIHNRFPISEEEKIIQGRNQATMSLTSTRRISRTIPGHIVQTPGRPKH
jgi:superfamily II helicase